MKPRSNYIINGGESGKSRLNILAAAMQPYTLQLLEKVGLQAGMRFLDNGCGGGHVAGLAAVMVGEKGQVTAADFDESILELAMQDAGMQQIGQIGFKCVNAYVLPFTEEFDVAYARFLLSHLNNPLLALQKMMRSVKNGGTIAVEDIHFSGHYSHPFSHAFQQYLQLYSQAVGLKGGNAEIGPTLPSLFKQAGIRHIQFDTVQPAFSQGEGKRMAWLTLDRIKQTLLQEQLVSHEQLQTLLAELEALAENEHSIVSLPRVFRVWGKVVR